MSWTQGYLGNIVKGILKIALAPVIITLLNGINLNLGNVTIGGSTVNLQILWDVVKVFGPIIMIYSGLRDLGVKL